MAPNINMRSVITRMHFIFDLPPCFRIYYKQINLEKFDGSLICLIETIIRQTNILNCLCYFRLSIDYKIKPYRIKKGTYQWHQNWMTTYHKVLYLLRLLLLTSHAILLVWPMFGKIRSLVIPDDKHACYCSKKKSRKPAVMGRCDHRRAVCIGY